MNKIHHTNIKFSIIIVNYNAWNYLRLCLPSLEQYVINGNEVIVIDNLSSDDSPNKIELQFPWVRLIRNTKNAGYAGGNNLGAHLANGKYLAFLNPDTIVEQGWLEELVNVLEINPRAGLATPQILLKNKPNQINACGNKIHITGITMCNGIGLERNSYSTVEEVAAVSGAGFLIRKDLFDYLGGFDESFFMYMEDTDLSIRARLAGYTCLYVPNSIIYHDYSLKFGKLKIYYQERNRYQMLLKNFQWRTIFSIMPLLVLSEVITWGFVLMKDRSHLNNKLRAYTWVLTHWGEIMYKRRKVQMLRTTGDHLILQSFTPSLETEQVVMGWMNGTMHKLVDPLFLLGKKVALLISK